MGDVVSTAIAAGRFRTLVAAVSAAGLVETLRGPGPFTVFAPTDEAFGRLPAGSLDALAADTAALAALLTYHVVPGRLSGADLIAARSSRPATANGAPLMVEVRNGAVYVNGARVITADVPARNGVIHVIDMVLQPTAPRLAAER